MKTFFEGEIFGQSALLQRLTELYDGQRAPQSLLITGPDQVGKSLVVERLCAALLSGETPLRLDGTQITSPTEVWRLITAGAHPDLHWVGLEPNDKGVLRSTITIGQVQALLDATQKTSTLAPVKVAVVDDADRMNANAANALLKRLEEPSARCRIILISSAPGRLLPTIRSRCQIVTSQALSRSAFDTWAVQDNLPAGEVEALYVLAGAAPGRARALSEPAVGQALAGLRAAQSGAVLAVQRFAKSMNALAPLQRGLIKQSYLSELHLQACGPEASADARAAAAERFERTEQLIRKADSLNMDEQSLWVRLLCGNG